MDLTRKYTKIKHPEEREAEILDPMGDTIIVVPIGDADVLLSHLNRV